MKWKNYTKDSNKYFMKIVVLGGTGILGNEMKKNDENLLTYGSDLDITKPELLLMKLDELNPDVIINCAAIKSESVDLDPLKSLDLNIIGSVNIAKYCIERNKRLVYISTDYVYPGIKGNYKEEDSLLPTNNYAWTKLAGEVPVRFVKNHLIIRTSFGTTKFDYEIAYTNLFTSKDYVDIIAPKILKISKSNLIGIVNIGTERKSIFDYANKRNLVNPGKLPSLRDFSLNTKKFYEKEQ